MKSENIFHPETPDEAMLLRYMAGQTTRREDQAVEEWVGGGIENEKIFSEVAQIYQAQRTRRNIDSRDSRSALIKVRGRIRRNLWRRRVQRVAVAASMVMGVAGAGALFYYGSGAGEDAPSLITVSSNDSSHTHVELPDGTQVLLNSGSSITYPSHYVDGRREVVLAGEAYFKVFRDENKPFVVTTPDRKYNVRVLGTEFNMQAYEQDGVIQTSLVSGSVEIDIDGTGKGTALLPSQKAIYYPDTHKLLVTTTDTDRETDWMYDRLVFRKTPMPEVISRLSRFYDVEFRVIDPVIMTYTFTGTFEDKPLFLVLDYMKISSGIANEITYYNDDNGTQSVVVLRK